jgi:hypothetical protein
MTHCRHALTATASHQRAIIRVPNTSPAHAARFACTRASGVSTACMLPRVRAHVLCACAWRRVGQVDISNAQATPGLFTENCFVLAQGEMHAGVFRVETLASPSARSDVSRCTALR